MRTPYSIEQLIPHIDLALMDSNTIQTNSIFKSIATTYDDDPPMLYTKLQKSKVLFLHPDGFDDWVNILLRHDTIDIKLLIISGSDISIYDTHIIPLQKKFPCCIFWITNWLGRLENCYTLPIGSRADTNNIIKNYYFGITYISYTSSERKELVDYLLSNEDLKKYIMPKQPHHIFIDYLKQFYFTACPPGNGPDTGRLWESLSVCTIPILLNHPFNRNLLRQYPKLPLILIDSWTELPALIETLSQEMYNKIYDSSECDVVYADYWLNKLDSIIR
jgi:hypothetical protein